MQDTTESTPFKNKEKWINQTTIHFSSPTMSFPRASLADVRVVTAQIKRPPKGHWEVVVQCHILCVGGGRGPCVERIVMNVYECISHSAVFVGVVACVDRVVLFVFVRCGHGHVLVKYCNACSWRTLQLHTLVTLTHTHTLSHTHPHTHSLVVTVILMHHHFSICVVVHTTLCVTLFTHTYPRTHSHLSCPA